MEGWSQHFLIYFFAFFVSSSIVLKKIPQQQQRKTHIVSDVLADNLGVKVHIKGHLHARCDVALHWSDGKVRQETVQVPPESENWQHTCQHRILNHCLPGSTIIKPQDMQTV